MIPFSEWLLFLLYIPDKRYKYGIKSFKLHEQRSYTYNTKQVRPTDQPVASQTVMELIQLR